MAANPCSCGGTAGQPGRQAASEEMMPQPAELPPAAHRQSSQEGPHCTPLIAVADSTGGRTSPSTSSRTQPVTSTASDRIAGGHGSKCAAQSRFD